MLQRIVQSSRSNITGFHRIAKRALMSLLVLKIVCNNGVRLVNISSNLLLRATPAYPFIEVGAEIFAAVRKEGKWLHEAAIDFDNKLYSFSITKACCYGSG